MTLQLSGATNFRDLGGYAADAGRRVRHYRLLRSDHLANLQARDLSLLAERLGHRLRVLDLRGAAEREAAACVIPTATVHSLPIEPTIVQKLTDLLESGQRITAADTVALMQETYRNFVRMNTHRFASLFSHLLDAQGAPLVFHCTAGKDRTGLAAALILSSLGVSAEDVMRDYLLTNERLAMPDASHHGLTPEVGAVLWRVQPEFLQAALEAVEADYGGLEGYFREGLRLGDAERARLRELYLERPADR